MLNVRVLYNKKPEEDFPINALRNIAEKAVVTTHAFHCDVDFIPSVDMHMELTYFFILIQG